METDTLRADVMRMLRVWDESPQHLKERVFKTRPEEMGRNWAALSDLEKGFYFGVARVALPPAIDSWDAFPTDVKSKVARGVAEWFWHVFDDEGLTPFPPR